MSFFATKSRAFGATFRGATMTGDGSGVKSIFPWYGSGRTVNITYSWGGSEADLDTRTYLVAPFGSVGGVMGWAYASGVPGIASWSGDNTGYGGSEYVTIFLDGVASLPGFMQTSEYVNSPSDLWLDIHMGAYFYGRYIDTNGDGTAETPDAPPNSATFNYQIQTFSGTTYGSQTAYHRQFVGTGINEFATYRLDLLSGFVSRTA